MFRRILFASMHSDPTPWSNPLYKEAVEEWTRAPWKKASRTLIKFMHSERVYSTAALRHHKHCRQEVRDHRTRQWIEYHDMMDATYLEPKYRTPGVKRGAVKNEGSAVDYKWYTFTAQFIPTAACLAHFQRCPGCWDKVRAAMVLDQMTKDARLRPAGYQ